MIKAKTKLYQRGATVKNLSALSFIVIVSEKIELVLVAIVSVAIIFKNLKTKELLRWKGLWIETQMLLNQKLKLQRILIRKDAIVRNLAAKKNTANAFKQG